MNELYTTLLETSFISNIIYLEQFILLQKLSRNHTQLNYREITFHLCSKLEPGKNPAYVQLKYIKEILENILVIRK